MEGFNYTFIIRDDKSNGAKNPMTGKWSGMIGDLMDYVSKRYILSTSISSTEHLNSNVLFSFSASGFSNYGFNDHVGARGSRGFHNAIHEFR